MRAIDCAFADLKRRGYLENWRASAQIGCVKYQRIVLNDLSSVR